MIAQQAAEAMREACAKVAETPAILRSGRTALMASGERARIAAAIRALPLPALEATAGETAQGAASDGAVREDVEDARDGEAKYMGTADDVTVRWGGNDDPRGVLTPGRWYLVDRVEEHSQHTKLWIGGKKYNCVDFVCPLHGKHMREPREVVRAVGPGQAPDSALRKYGKHLPGCQLGWTIPNCPDCGDHLEVPRAPGYLNREQWDSVKAGDYFCSRCRGSRAENSAHRYFWEHELPKRPCSCGLDAALAGSAEAERAVVEAAMHLQLHVDHCTVDCVRFPLAACPTGDGLWQAQDAACDVLRAQAAPDPREGGQG